MAVSYKRLWKLLIDRDMKKKELAERANLSTYTINKLNRGENVNTDTLAKICRRYYGSSSGRTQSLNTSSNIVD